MTSEYVRIKDRYPDYDSKTDITLSLKHPDDVLPPSAKEPSAGFVSPRPSLLISSEFILVLFLFFLSGMATPSLYSALVAIEVSFPKSMLMFTHFSYPFGSKIHQKLKIYK